MPEPTGKIFCRALGYRTLGRRAFGRWLVTRAAIRAAVKAGRVLRVRRAVPRGPGGRKFFRRKKVCKFCVEKIDGVNYKTCACCSSSWRRAGKIVPRRSHWRLHTASASGVGGHQAGAQYRLAAVLEPLSFTAAQAASEILKTELCMEVILKEDVIKLGSRGDVVKVAAGYGRNYLLPKKLAIEANAANKAVVVQMKASAVRRNARRRRAPRNWPSRSMRSSELHAQAGEGDHLFGSVTSSDIAAELTKKSFDIDRRKIQLHEPLKQLGDFTIAVKLHKEVTAHFKGCHREGSGRRVAAASEPARFT